MNGENSDILPERKIRLTDIVEYKDLKRGEKYTAKGVLMDKATGKPALDPEGKQITAEKEFRAITTSGRVKVIFEFDATSMFGKDTVVFERVFDSEGHIAAKHEEIDDEGHPGTRTLGAYAWDHSQGRNRNGRKPGKKDRQIMQARREDPG